MSPFTAMRLKAARFLAGGNLSRITLPYNTFSSAMMNADMHSFLDQGYGGNVYVHSVIKQIADRCGSIPWTVYRVKDEKALLGYRQKAHGGVAQRFYGETRQLKKRALEAVDGTDLNKLFEEPNSFMAWSEYIETLQTFYQATGNSFVLGIMLDTGPRAGTFFELLPYTPLQVKIEAPAYPEPVTRYLVGVTEQPVDPVSILHMKTVNPLNPRIGLAPMEAALPSVKQSLAYAEWNESLVNNLGGLNGLLTIEGEDLDDAKIDKILATYKQRQSGGSKAGLPMVTNGKATYTPTAVNPKDMEWIKGVQLTADQIALAFDWPPELLGNEANKTYANTRDMLRFAYMGKIIPEMDRMRDCFNKFVVRPFNKPGAEFFADYNLEEIEILQEERRSVNDRAVADWNAGLITLNEARAQIGLDGVGPEGDVRQIPVGLAGFNDQQLQDSIDNLAGKGVKDY